MIDQALKGRATRAKKHGKLAVGVQFALEKLTDLNELNGKAKVALATQALEKIRLKNIMLPNYLSAALEKAKRTEQT